MRSDRAARRLTPYHALALLGALPLVVLAAFAYVISARAVDDMVRAGNDATATITAAMMERESEYWTATLASHAGFPAISAAVVAGDVEEVRRRLEILIEAHPRLDRAFVTDMDGTLWVDYPEAPEMHGRNFSQRDWYRGATRTRAAYVSEIYRRSAPPQPLVVAVSTPVLDPATEDEAGFMVIQLRLDSLSDLLRRVEVGAEGIVFVVDHTGALVAHPDLEVQDAIRREYAQTLASLRPDNHSALRRGRYVDPFSGETVMAAALSAHVRDHEWIVVSQQPVTQAFAPTRALAWQLTGAGALMTALVFGLVWGLGRENLRRRQAEMALTSMNQDLERRVEERTAALRQKEEEFLQAQKMEAVGRLAGGIAHDFNNLLTVILGCTEILLERAPKGSAERREIEATHEAAQRGARLTRQLLAFSRKQVVQPRTLNLNAVLQEMRGLLDRVTGANIELVWRLSPTLHPVLFDVGQVEQIVMNLAVNACDAMPEGGTLIIETKNVALDETYAAEHPDARPGPHVMLAVTDTGIGMDADTRKKIFEPFYTTKRRGHGTGLGLSTVYGIVRQGGGNVWVYSEPGRGSAFKVYLPRAADSLPAEAEHSPDAVASGTATLLLVEDEAEVRAMLVRMLSTAGYRVLETATAEEARATFQRNERAIDLLITDVVLPDVSGLELAAALTRHQPTLKVLYMSGYTGDAVAHDGMLDPGMAFIEKPFEFQAFLHKVQGVLSSGQA